MELHKIRKIEDFNQYQNEFLDLFDDYLIRDLANIVFTYYIQCYIKEIDELILPENKDYYKVGNRKTETICQFELPPGLYRYVGYLERDSSIRGTIYGGYSIVSTYISPGNNGMEPLHMRNNNFAMTKKPDIFRIKYTGPGNIKFQNVKFIVIQTRGMIDVDSDSDPENGYFSLGPKGVSIDTLSILT